MSPTYASKKGKHYRYYICSNAQKRGWDHCPSQSVPAGPMEGIVLEQISKVGQDPERLQKILSEASKQRGTRLANLESERRRLERELKILMETFVQANGTSDDKKRSVSGFETIQENIGHLERRLTENQELTRALQQPALELEQAVQVLMAFERAFDERSVSEQARLIHLMVQRIDYDGGQGTLALTLDPAGLVAVLEEHAKQQENSK